MARFVVVVAEAVEEEVRNSFVVVRRSELGIGSRVVAGCSAAAAAGTEAEIEVVVAVETARSSQRGSQSVVQRAVAEVA